MNFFLKAFLSKNLSFTISWYNQPPPPQQECSILKSNSNRVNPIGSCDLTRERIYHFVWFTVCWFMFFLMNKTKSLESCDKLSLSQKLKKINCQSQLVVDLSKLSISVNCRAPSIVEVSQLSISVDC